MMMVIRSANRPERIAGDLFLDTSTGNVDELAAGTWTLEGNIEGPAGTTREVRLLAPPPAPAPAAPPPESARPAPPVATVVHRKPLGPVVFAVGTGLTVAGVAATIVSGVLATSDPGTANVKRDCVGLGSSCPEYQRGLAAQLRTNVFLGATGGIGLLTAVVGIFFTQWTRAAASASSPSVLPYASAVPGALDVGVRATF